MQKGTRTTKVLLSLVISMTVGAIVLMALDNHSLSAGPFSLSSYTNLNSVEEAASNRKNLSSGDEWDTIEVYYSQTVARDTTDMAKLTKLLNGNNADFHFFVCNGLGGSDGLIQPTEKWHKQTPCLVNSAWFKDSMTIRICVIADSKKSPPTDCQIRRTNALVETLSRKYDVAQHQISYPTNWKL